MTTEHIDYPFAAEYAKSNRSACKGCKNLISQDSLRMAVMVQSPHFDGKIPNWYHFSCFFKKNRVTSVSTVKHYETLRWDDQQKIQQAISGKPIASTSDGDSKGAPVDSDSLMKLFVVEYAKSNRSACKVCNEKIKMNDVRISIKDMHGYRGPTDQWHHVDCFVNKRDDLVEDEEAFAVSKIPGFSSLSEDDQNDLKKKLPAKKKRKASAPDSAPVAKKSKEDNELEKGLKEQSELLWQFRDKLTAEVSKNALIGLLEYNNQGVPSGEANLLDRVSDAMVFGALAPCPECKGHLTYSRSGYRCTGNVTEWTRCQYKTKTPIRGPFKVPKEYHDVDFLKKYVFTKRDRLFPPDMDEADEKNGKSGDPKKPLDGLRFVVTKGPFSGGKKKKQLEDAIRQMGGKIATKVDNKVAAVIGTKEEVEASDPQVAIVSAKNNNVHVVKEEFLDAVTAGGVVLMIQSHSIASWGGDPLARIGDAVASSSKSGFARSLAKQEKAFKKELGAVKMTVKGGAAVDPDSGLEDVAHILQGPDKAPYNAVLGAVDLISGNNSFYKLQVLEKDKSSTCYVFRAWGRIGTTIGGNKLETFHCKEAAVNNFKELYLEKTGNEWTERATFQKKPNKFYPLELDYGESEEVKVDMSKSSSKLDPSIQDLIRFIFDIESMKSAMLEFEIDLKKMPLGKLSKNQIDKAYAVLTELSELIEKGTGTQTLFLDASTRFYTLIPHDFGMQRPPLLNTMEQIKMKSDMLDSLLEIEVAYSMLKTKEGEDPIDSHYAKLNAKLKPLDKSSEEYSRLVQYVANTHAPSHSTYKLEVAEIFEIVREGEEGRFKPFKKLHNHMLLWHGSRRTNWAGIISQGLRIAPPEAPVTGYMFGKGVYFADMVSKSANYCFTNRTNPEGLMLLCEVALGNMAERYGADTHIKLKPNEHSCKGLGSTVPNSAEFYTAPDGVVYPMGHPTTASLGKTSSLLYNEYIVYDIGQVQQKYLLRMKFKY